MELSILTGAEDQPGGSLRWGYALVRMFGYEKQLMQLIKNTVSKHVDAS